MALGDPFRSIVLYRALKFGRGHMPQFGSTVLDREGVKLLHDWIGSLPKLPTTSGDTSTSWQADLSRLLEQASSEAGLTSLLNSTRTASL